MSVILLLGPSEWDPERGSVPRRSPMDVRHDLAHILAEEHEVALMEDEPDHPDEDLVDKFDRLLTERRVTDVVVYWPPRAKMQTTYDELILLRDRADATHATLSMGPPPAHRRNDPTQRIQSPRARRPKPLPHRSRSPWRPPHRMARRRRSTRKGSSPLGRNLTLFGG